MKRTKRITKAWQVLPLCAVSLIACGGGSNNGGNGNGNGNGGTPTPSAKGGFTATWQAISMDVTTYNGAGQPQQQTVDVPPLVKDPVSDRNLEMYVSFEGDKRVIYARYEGSGPGDSSYTIRQVMQHVGEGESEMYAVPSGNDLYTLRDGLLEETTTRQLDDGTGVLSVTKFRRLEKFPPEGWPTQTQSYEAGDQP